jgi:dodecin
MPTNKEDPVTSADPKGHTIFKAAGRKKNERFRFTFPLNSERFLYMFTQKATADIFRLRRKEETMNSVYKVIELVGTSPESWEKAAAAAVEQAAESLRDLRIAEVVKLDMKVENGKVTAYRARINVSFKYKGS